MFGVFTDQGGPRGGRQGFSTNMAMGAGSRVLGGGMFTLRAMASLEPLMGPQGYRLLLQTGETADGRTHLVDRQHPHDLAMELAAIYSQPVGTRTSALRLPRVAGRARDRAARVHAPRLRRSRCRWRPSSHHWLDATHIAFGSRDRRRRLGPGQAGGLRFQRARAGRRALELRAARDSIRAPRA